MHIDREKVKEILGEVIYNKCYALFKELLESSARYKIVMTRRCFSLYKIFAPILAEDGIENAKGTQILTDRSVPIHLSQIQEALQSDSILIVDDVIIYGRTIGVLLDKIVPSSAKSFNAIKQNIHVLCLVKNMNYSRLKKEYAELITWYVSAYDDSWRVWSVQLSTLISQCPIANTSYVVSAFCNRDEGSFGGLRFDEGNDTPLAVECVEQPCLMDYAEATFVRIYEHEEGMLTIIPLVILKEMSSEEMNTLCARVSRRIKLDSNYETTKLLACEDEDLQQTRMQLVSLLLSHAVLRRFLAQHKYSYAAENTDYNVTLSCNFSEKIRGEFTHYDADFDGLLEVNFKPVEDFNESMDLNIGVLYASIKDTASCIRNGFSGGERGDSISLADKCEEQHYFTLSRLIDSGKASIRTNYRKETGFCSLLFSGEQAFMIGNDIFSHNLEGVRYAEFLYGIPQFRKQSAEFKRDFYKQILAVLIENNQVAQSEESRCIDLLNHLADAGMDIEFIYYNGCPDHGKTKLSDLVKSLIEKEVNRLVSTT